VVGGIQQQPCTKCTLQQQFRKSLKCVLNVAASLDNHIETARFSDVLVQTQCRTALHGFFPTWESRCGFKCDVLQPIVRGLLYVNPENANALYTPRISVYSLHHSSGSRSIDERGDDVHPSTPETVGIDSDSRGKQSHRRLLGGDCLSNLTIDSALLVSSK
jgi:hypothetical protein